MANPVTKAKDSIDWGLVFTLLVTALLLGGLVWGLKKVPLKAVKAVAKEV